MSRVGYHYRGFSVGGFWGIQALLIQMGYSDKCVEEGGQRRSSVITQYNPNSQNAIPQQVYGVPGQAIVRRVSRSFLSPFPTCIICSDLLTPTQSTGAYFYMAVNPQGKTHTVLNPHFQLLPQCIRISVTNHHHNIGNMTLNRMSPRPAAEALYQNQMQDWELPLLEKSLEFFATLVVTNSVTQAIRL
jgi:hypothetical protein